MKQLLLFFISLLLSISVSQSQVLIAQWTFPTGSSGDSIADGGITSNLNKAIRTDGETSAIDFSKNGFTTKAAQATGWNDGAGLKSWVVEITTTDYENLTLSSRQQSGGNNPGPRDWKVQYRIGTGGDWTDIPSAVIEVQNDWTTSFLDGIPLPAECKNLPSLFLRWIMTTNTNSAGNPVEASGINKIDDIVFTGTLINTAIPEPANAFAISVFPNPCTNQITVSSPEKLQSLMILDATGRIVHAEGPQEKEVTLDVSQLPAGTYLIRATAHRALVTTARFFRLD